MIPTQTRILVVDDMLTVRSILKTHLRSMDLKNITDAENGARAYELLEGCHSNGQPIELVLSDWNMPVLTGIELLEKVRKSPLFKTLPFIFITAEGELEQVKTAIGKGVTDFIKKPFSRAGFQERLVSAWCRSHGLPVPSTSVLEKAGA